jgi:hypothetical protein
MSNEEINIRNLLLNLERLLLDNSVRTDQKRISGLLFEQFKEYTSSGKVYRYKPGDVFGENKEEIRIIESSFEVFSLSPDIKLVNYQTLKESNGNGVKTNRSSIWKKTDTAWKIVFHQGTICAQGGLS